MKDRKIVDYRVISEVTEPIIYQNYEYNGWLELAVNDYIKKGWEPLGPPIFIKDHRDYTGLAQAMVKYSEDT